MFARARERLVTLNVSGVRFKLQTARSVGDKAVALPMAVVSHCDGEYGSTHNGQIWMAGSSFLSSQECHDLVRAAFGVTVKTYFIDKGVLVGNKHRKNTASFYEYAAGMFEKEYAAEMQAAQGRLLKQTQELLESSETVRLGEEFLAQHAVADIKLALAAYAHLGKDILKQAIQEYIVDDVFEFDS
jgi:hypothetical protein